MKKMCVRTVLISALASVALALTSIQAPADTGTLQVGADTLADPPAYALAVASPDWVEVPGGLAHVSCVHAVPDEAEVLSNGEVLIEDRVIETIPVCPYTGIVRPPEAVQADSPDAGVAPAALTSGWWLNSWWTSANQIVSLSAQWTVPAKPASNGALIYFFPSVTPATSGAIVQPVLQWGVSPAGGGNHWALANWWVSGGTVLHGALKTTAAGRTITGKLERSSGTSTAWTMTFKDSSGVSGTLIAGGGGQSSWRAVQGGALEVYDATSCKQLPNASSVKFSKITVKSTSGKVTPSFLNQKRVSSCSSSVTSTSSTTTLGWKAS